MNSSIVKKVQDFDVTTFNFIIDLIFIVNQDVKYDDKFKIDEFIAKSTIQIQTKLIIFIKSSSIFKQFLHVIISKWEKKVASNEKKRDEHRDKIVRIMLILIIQDFDKTNIIEWILFAEVNKKFNKEFVDKFVISISESYEKQLIIQFEKNCDWKSFKLNWSL